MEGPPSREAEPKRDFSRTLVGQGPVVVDPSAPPATSQAPGPDAPAPAAAATRAPGVGRGTIMGMGLVTPIAANPARPADPVSPEPATVPHPEPPPPAGGGIGHRTVLGLAPPPPVPPAGLGGTVVMAPQQKTLTGNAPEPVLPPGATDRKPPTKTILGVARPGIAPLHPGEQKAAITETFPSPPPPPPSLAGPVPLATVAANLEPYFEPAPSSPAPQRRSTLLAAIVIFAALLLLAGAGAVFYFMRGPGRIEAKAGLDSDGRERLSLVCASCTDGSTVKLGASQAAFRGGRAELAVPGGLKVGENRFELAVTAAGSSRASRVSLTVPLEFRVRADTTPLAEATPKLAIAIEAVPGSVVLVDDKPVPLPADGRTRYELDVVAALTGQDSSVRRLERKARYTITPPGRASERGEITFQMGIVPLVLDAPGESITIETSTFVLAGRTQKGASVSVGGRPLNVDADGRFDQTMSVSSPGETIVTARASLPESAPRLYGFKVRRVNSLRDEAKARQAAAITAYSALLSDADKKAQSDVALDGSVIELNETGRSTLILLDTKSGCPKAPCITRVIHGARLALALGDNVSVYGTLKRSVEGARSGTRVPEVFADFVLKGRR